MRPHQPAGQDCFERITELVSPTVPPRPPPEAQLAIVQPADNLHLWRNPNLPAALNRLVLHASVQPKAAQIVWLINGQPVSLADSAAPLVWTMTPGRYRFQVRLPLQDTISAPVHVVVE